jgi:hypothetical protein
MAGNTSGSPRAPLAVPGLAAIALGLVALHAAVLTRYGWFRDELYYLSCAKRLAWSYVDQPPLSIAVLAAVRAVFGDGLAVLRLTSALVATVVIVLAALLARQLGGGRYAQLLSAIAIGTAPLVLALGHYYSMNVFDFGFWLLGALLFLRALERPTRTRWAALGVCLGLGLLNKWSVLWLGAGVGAGLVLTRHRRLLATPGPWIAAGLAGAVFAPAVAWQVGHGWPTLEFIRNASEQKMRASTPLALLANQLLLLGPGALPLWLAGLVWRGPDGAARLLQVIFVTTFAVLVAQGHARGEYLALGLIPLVPAGAVFFERRGRALRALAPALLALLFVPIVPFALPVLSVERFVEHQARMGLAPSSEERHRMGALPQHYADMFGWPELADSVARVAATLTPAERAGAIVLVDNYGEAGALEKFGAGRIPRIACRHNNWYLWGPPSWDGRVAILIGADSSQVAARFGSVAVAGLAGHPLAMPYEQGLPILVVRGFRGDLQQAWREGKNYQ